MKLKQLVLSNIFIYNGHHTIKMEDLTFIVGRNGYGKTSLINSCKLCLGNIDVDMKKILNSEAAEDAECYVEMDLDEFVIRRSWNVLTKSESLTVKGIDISADGAEAEEFISNKFPSFIVDIMFYDGEQDSNILMMKDSKFKRFFEFVLDVDILSDLKKDSLAAANILLAKQPSTGKVGELKVANQKFEDILLDKNTVSDRLSEESAENRRMEKELSKLDTKIRKSNKDIFFLKNELDVKRVILMEHIEKFKKVLLFEMPLILNPRLSASGGEKPAANILNKDAFRTAFMKSLGGQISDEQAADEMFTLFVQSVSGDILSSYTPSTSLLSFKELLSTIRSIKEEISYIEEKISAIENSEISTSEFSRLTEEKNILLPLFEESSLLVQHLEESLESISLAYKEAKLSLAALYRDNKSEFAALGSVEELRAVANTAQTIYSKKISRSLIEINNFIKESTVDFRAAYPKIKSISVNKMLELEIIDRSDHVMARAFLSAGQKQFLHFLIVEAIMKSKNFMPFVLIDTPIGRLDVQNKRDIIQKCYLRFDQVVLLLTNAELADIAAYSTAGGREEDIRKTFPELKHYLISSSLFGSSITQGAL